MDSSNSSDENKKTETSQTPLSRNYWQDSYYAISLLCFIFTLEVKTADNCTPESSWECGDHLFPCLKRETENILGKQSNMN